MASDSAGVMPDPATTKTWSPGVDRSAVNRPAGGSTSISSPGRTECTSHEENSPPGTSRTPIRSEAPAGAQME